MRKQRRNGRAVAVATALALAGCGGDGATGGDGLSAPPAAPPSAPASGPTAKAEGAYAGRTSRGVELSMLILDDDTVWGLYERDGLLVGFLQGGGISENRSITVADVRDFDFVDRVTRHGTASATFFAGVSIQGTMIPAVGNQFSFDATTAAVTGYDYNRPAALAEILGRWRGFYEDGFDRGPVDISPNGAVSAMTSLGCNYTGTVVPRASGRNVYDIRITFGAPPCQLAGGTATGIAIIVEPVAGARQLLVAAIDATRELGVTFVGTR